MTDERKAFVVPEGHVPLCDIDGRSTGETMPERELALAYARARAVVEFLDDKIMIAIMRLSAIPVKVSETPNPIMVTITEIVDGLRDARYRAADVRAINDLKAANVRAASEMAGVVEGWRERALKAEAANELQPIETAPRGKKVLLVNSVDFWVGYWPFTPSIHAMTMTKVRDGDWRLDAPPATHWMPLPELANKENR